MKNVALMDRQQVRRLAGKLMEEWQDVEAVADALGCPAGSIRRWYREYRQNLADREASSREPGRPPKLTRHQQTIIRDIVFTRTPRDMNIDMALWSNTAIQALIKDLFRTQVSLGTVNALITKLDVARRPPLRQDSAAGDGLLAAWLHDRYPMIRKLAKAQHASVFFVHDDRIVSRANGSALEAASGGRRDHDPGPGIRVLSATCPRNSQRFMVFRESFGPRPFVAFLKGLMHDIDRRLFLVVPSVYKACALEADPFLASVMDRLTLFFLPQTNGNSGRGDQEAAAP